MDVPKTEHVCGLKEILGALNQVCEELIQVNNRRNSGPDPE